MKPIIEPIAVELILQELNDKTFFRTTNKANNEIYIIDGHNSPNTMREIGRLREEAFRADGGGTGEEVDIDYFDTMDTPCQQLIVWNPEAQEIIGGYRFILGENIKYDEEGQPIIATAHLFKFSDKFIKDYLPYTLELGRSFVNIKYQSAQGGAKSLFALDNLWDGLGALTVIYPEIKYFFGKFTMYPTFNSLGRDMILHYLNIYFGDKDQLVTTIHPLNLNEEHIPIIEKKFSANNLKEDYKILNQEVRTLGENIPPLVNAYTNLSSTMKVFGTAINDEFGNVEETGILITINDIYPEKRTRHIDSYQPQQN
jgi:hypothetical protein